jgi:hypothetical protein
LSSFLKTPPGTWLISNISLIRDFIQGSLFTSTKRDITSKAETHEETVSAGPDILFRRSSPLAITD